MEAGLKRTEMMSPEVRARVIAWIRTHRPSVVDLTGGAPELIPGFRDLVMAARDAGAQVIDRCNLAVLDEPGQEDLVEFLAEHGVTVVASLPFYLADNVDRQRGRGTYDRSIAGLQRLNIAGFGRVASRPPYLVYNPGGPSLPPAQHSLETAYRGGKGAYYGLVCSCGALAETMGDRHHEKIPHGKRWNRLIPVGQVILATAAVILILHIISWIWPAVLPPSSVQAITFERLLETCRRLAPGRRAWYRSLLLALQPRVVPLRLSARSAHAHLRYQQEAFKLYGQMQRAIANGVARMALRHYRG